VHWVTGETEIPWTVGVPEGDDDLVSDMLGGAWMKWICEVAR
jgi:hypothetical protein